MTIPTDQSVRVGQFSAYYGDRHGTLPELLASGVEVLTGDYLAELTMLVMHKKRARGGAAYAEAFIDQLTGHLAEIKERGIVVNPTLGELAAAMDVIPGSPGIRLHSHEAWYDAKTAIRGAAAQGGDKSLLHAELAKARNALRHSGRRERRRIISRTLLVKGLEYDHVIIADAGNHTEVNDLYVALTRARKSIHILAIGGSITLVESPRGPKAPNISQGPRMKQKSD